MNIHALFQKQIILIMPIYALLKNLVLTSYLVLDYFIKLITLLIQLKDLILNPIS